MRSLRTVVLRLLGVLRLLELGELLDQVRTGSRVLGRGRDLAALGDKILRDNLAP